MRKLHTGKFGFANNIYNTTYKGEYLLSEYGIKIKNIKAATLYGYNKGLRDRYDFTDAMLNKSLFSNYMQKIGMNIYKGESTRDIICLEFDFGSRSYKDEILRLHKILEKTSLDSKSKILKILDKIEKNKDLYDETSKDAIREDFYQSGVEVEYKTYDKEGNIKAVQNIKYKMLYRTPSKAKIGQVMFINEKFYKKAYDWLTMGIGNLMPLNNAKIVEMSAYAPLTTSTIFDTIHIPVEDILILEDKNSFFETIAKVVEAEEYIKYKKVLDEDKTNSNKENATKFTPEGTPIFRKAYKKMPITEKRCVVKDKITRVKNTIWDGMGLIESELLNDDINGMVLLRNHFFKMCGFRSNIKQFFQDWCEKNGKDYESYIIYDMFGLPHYFKDIKIITTNNSIKWMKFKELMGANELEAYQYWCKRINSDGSYFGIVKTDHESKLGKVQQMSYQMINTLPCNKDDIRKIAKTSIEYVELLKRNSNEFENYLRTNSNKINHFEMLADLYDHNHDFASSKWFRYEKKEIIKSYVNRLRKGKITVNGDNLTICGNPYALLLYSVGEDWENDKTLNHEEGVIQCYTSRFEDGDYLCAIRNPHNSPNNICYLHNVYSAEIEKYFEFSDNIIAVNCIKSDIQDRANGMDEDSDFFFVTNHDTMANYAKICYRDYPTIVNNLKESNITYKNTKMSYADMDNKFSKSRMSIGESSNLAQLAMTYYWTNPKSKDLYDNFVILSVIAQVAIDSCKREYEVDPISEIERIKKMDCMNLTREVTIEEKVKKLKYDLPEFMKYTKEVKHTKNGKELPYEEVKEKKDKIRNRINPILKCPMNWLQEVLTEIQMADNSNTLNTEDFFIKMKGEGNRNQINKIKELVSEYDEVISRFDFDSDEETTWLNMIQKTEEYYNQIRKIKIGNLVTINRIIETALGLEKNNNKKIYVNTTKKYCRKILNCLYRTNKDKFLVNFIEKLNG